MEKFKITYLVDVVSNNPHDFTFDDEIEGDDVLDALRKYTISNLVKEQHIADWANNSTLEELIQYWTIIKITNLTKNTIEYSSPSYTDKRRNVLKVDRVIENTIIENKNNNNMEKFVITYIVNAPAEMETENADDLMYHVVVEAESEIHAAKTLAISICIGNRFSGG